MSSIDEIRDTRIKKLALLRQKGIDPYPAVSKRELSLKEAVLQFTELEKEGEAKWVSGRVMSVRGQGAIIFLTLNDGTAHFQGLLKKDELGFEKFDFFHEVVDIGDFIELRGNFFTTQRGEKTVSAKDWRMLSKSLRPLPEKWHGLQDAEERFRKRYLDILMNEELKDIFIKKEKFWDVTRAVLKREGFLEVETPTLEITTGGAEARPFITHHNDYDLDVYLRISIGELWQKRLMAAGFPKTFEIGRAYRNEGSNPEHTQEFTNTEFYASYMSFEEGMAFTEKLIKEVAKETFGTLSFKTRDEEEIDLSPEWPKIDYAETVQKMTGIDLFKATDEEIKKKLSELKVSFEGENRERLTDTLWKYCRRQVSGPAWLIHHPKLVSPLAKENPENKDTTLRAQLIIGGSEMVNGYAELNDPIEQNTRFETQAALIEKGDDEAMMQDDEFVEMLEYGMPPVCSFGWGERLFSTFLGKSLRETQLFPLMKPKNLE